ncbi:MAG: hypothetical protein KC609_22425 [Myxococcales bacterium]|nr:hypothetical protein [Myxococcales bacterium]
MKPALLLLLASFFWIPIGCGGNLRIEPLIGEDPAVVKFIRSKYPAKKNIQGLQRLVGIVYRAFAQKDFATVYRNLSTPTRAYLDEVATFRGLKATDVLRMGKLPKERSKDAEWEEVDMLAWVLMHDLQQVTSELSGVSEKSKDLNEEIVFLVDAQSNFKPLRLYHERDGWKLHPAPRR